MANTPENLMAPQPWGGTPSVPPSSGGSPVAPQTPGTPHVPAPTVDVQVRTMQSDLASLQQSGGNTVAAETIALHIQPATGMKRDVSHAFRSVVVTVISLAVLAGLAFAGYSLYKRLVQSPAAPSSGTSATSSATGTTPSGPTVQNPSTQIVEELPGAHRSLLKKSAEAGAVLALNNAPVSDPTKLHTYSQTLRALLNTLHASTTEIEVRNNAGKPISFPAFLSFINAPIIDTKIYQDNFNLDFSFLAVREGAVFNAAYVLQLQPGKNWLFVKGDIAKLENASGLESLFPVLPGARADAGFQDGILMGQAVRTLTYSTPDGKFVYGWFRDYLILATSPNAFQAALSKVQ